MLLSALNQISRMPPPFWADMRVYLGKRCWWPWGHFRNSRFQKISSLARLCLWNPVGLSSHFVMPYIQAQPVFIVWFYSHVFYFITKGFFDRKLLRMFWMRWSWRCACYANVYSQPALASKKLKLAWNRDYSLLVYFTLAMLTMAAKCMVNNVQAWTLCDLLREALPLHYITIKSGIVRCCILEAFCNAVVLKRGDN